MNTPRLQFNIEELRHEMAVLRAEIGDTEYSLKEREAFIEDQAILSAGLGDRTAGEKAIGTNEAARKRNLQLAVYSNERWQALSRTLAQQKLELALRQAKLDAWHDEIRYRELLVREALAFPPHIVIGPDATNTYSPQE